MICKNCGGEIIETSKGRYLHAYNINIGSKEKPYVVKGLTLLSRTTNCYYPEVSK